MITLAQLVALHFILFLVDDAYKYRVQTWMQGWKNNLDAILASMYRSRLYQTCCILLAILLTLVAFQRLTMLLFGTLSRNEVKLILFMSVTVFFVFADIIFVLQPVMNVWTLLQFCTFYYLLVTTILLNKRAEAIAHGRLRRWLLRHIQSNWITARLILANSALLLLSLFGLTYQYGQLHHSSNYPLTIVTLYGYIEISFQLFKSFFTYILMLIILPCYGAHNSLWNDKLFALLLMMNAAFLTIVTASNLITICALYWHRIGLISLILNFDGSVYLAKKSWIQAIRGVGLLYAFLDAFPVASTEEVIRIEQCSICLEDMSTERLQENRRIADCIHVFHYGCLKDWARIRNDCPNCRTEFRF